jgi:hypothetical protein
MMKKLINLMVQKRELSIYRSGKEFGEQLERRRILGICIDIACNNKNGDYVYLADLEDYLENNYQPKEY